MTDIEIGLSRKKPRVILTEKIRKHFLEDILKQGVSEFSRVNRVPYLLVYNLVHSRIKTLSARNYRKIFGEEPPRQEMEKVDGEFFRKMVDLWISLNPHVTKAALYLEFYGWKHPRKIDYRIFNGKIATVESRLVKIMAGRFAEAGLDEADVRKWMDELMPFEQEDRIPYRAVRPALLFLKIAARVNPSLLLNQRFERYESGELRSIPAKTAQKIDLLKNRAERMLRAGRKIELEKLRHEASGRIGFVLYSEVKEELEFLRQFAGESPRRYLGRSPGSYERSKLKRIAARRAQKIRDACAAFIKWRPDLPLACLPAAFRRAGLTRMLAVLRLRAAHLLLRHEGVALEKKILTPASHKKEDYTNGYTRFEIAPKVLGMRKPAFDLMVAENCDIFRGVGTYLDRWYLPDLYLKELRSKKYFDLVAAKYEWLAKQGAPADRAVACLN